MRSGSLLARARSAAPMLLFTGAGVATILPWILHPWEPTPWPGEAHDAYAGTVTASRLLAGALAVAGTITLGLRLQRAPERTLRQATALALAAAILAVACLVPNWDARADAATDARYTAGGHAHRMEGISLGDADAPGYETGGTLTRVGDTVTIPIPQLARGDEILIGVGLHNLPGATVEPPALLGSGLTCASEAHLDALLARDPSYSVWWRCTAEGDGARTLALHAPTEGATIQANVLIQPAYVTILRSLDDSLALAAAWTLAAVAGCALLHAGRDPARHRIASRTAALAGGSLALAWGLAILGAAAREARAGADPSTPILSLYGTTALAVGVVGLAAAHAWHAGGDARAAALRARVFAWGAVGLLVPAPLLALAVVVGGDGFVRAAVLLVHLVAGAALVGLALSRWGSRVEAPAPTAPA